MAPLALARALSPLFQTYVLPVVVCVGSDRVLGDCLGPIVGSMLQRENVPAFLYGSLASPVTAREAAHLAHFLAKTHPLSPVLAIDAAVGEKREVGLIKLNKGPLYPGSGANKRLGALGDCAILGITAERDKGFSGLESARLGLVGGMAGCIAEAVSLALGGRSRARTPLPSLARTK